MNATQYQVADILLAEQLGWTALTKEYGDMWGYPPGSTVRSPMPRWTQSWGRAGGLISQYGLIVNADQLGEVTVSWRDGGDDTIMGGYLHTERAYVGKHEHLDDILRLAIVLAAYKKLANKGKVMLKSLATTDASAV